jgi:hypothetical protein
VHDRVGPLRYVDAGSFATKPSRPRRSTVSQAARPSGSRRRTGSTIGEPATASSRIVRRRPSGSAHVLAPDLEDVEGHEHRRRAQHRRVGIPEESEARHELLVEDGHFAVQHQDLGPELRDRGRELAEARRVVHGSAADQSDAAAFLVGEEPPAVDLLLDDPAGAVEGRTGQHGKRTPSQKWGHRRHVIREPGVTRSVLWSLEEIAGLAE